MTDQTAQSAAPPKPSPATFSRRSLFRAAGVGAAVVGGGALPRGLQLRHQGRQQQHEPQLQQQQRLGASSGGEITIGWIHPLTGSLAGFGVPDNWVIQQIMATSQYKNGFKIGGTTYKVNIKSYDTQSSVTQAGTLAKQAIQHDNVDLLFASSTPETVNAVASQAETLGTPLICSNIPWESWYINLGGNPTPEADPQAEVHDHVLPRRRAPGPGLHPDVEPDRREVRQQPHRRRRVPERLRRQRVPRRVPADRQGRRATRSTCRPPTPTG